MKNIRELLQTRPLLFDGAMGTYYKAAPGVECEQANLTDPAGVLAVHREYLAAGADAVKTNTFSLPRLAAAHTPGWEQLAQAGWQLAVQAAGETGAAVFAVEHAQPPVIVRDALHPGVNFVPVRVCIADVQVG